MVILVPDEILRPHAEYCVKVLGMNDKDIMDYLQDKYDHETYGLK